MVRYLSIGVRYKIWLESIAKKLGNDTFPGGDAEQLIIGGLRIMLSQAS